MDVARQTPQNIAIGWVTQAPTSGGAASTIKYGFTFKWLWSEGGFSLTNHLPERGFEDEATLRIATPAKEGEMAFYSIVGNHFKVRLLQGAEVFGTDECENNG